MSDSTFFEQFDHGSPAPRRSTKVVPFTALVLGLLVLAVLALWFFVLKDDGPSAEERLNAGLAAHVEGRLDEAAQIYQEILADDPTNKIAHYNLGLIAQTNGRTEDAERSYQQALATDPLYTPALFNLAVMRYEAGDFDGAIELYRQLIEVNPNDAVAHLNLGFALRADGDEREGDQEIQIAIGLDPSLAPRAQTTDTTQAPEEPSSDETTTTTAVE